MLDIFERAVATYAQAYRDNPLEHFRETDVICNMVAQLKKLVTWKIGLVLDQGIQADLYKFRDTDLLASPVLTRAGIHGDDDRKIDLCLLDGETATVMPAQDGSISSIAPPIALAVEITVSHGGDQGSRLDALRDDRDRLSELLAKGTVQNAAVLFVDHRCKRFLKRDADACQALFSGSGIAFHHVSRFGYERDFKPLEP